MAGIAGRLLFARLVRADKKAPMKKIATTKTASQPSVRRAGPARKPSHTHEEIIGAIVARADLVPDQTELVDADDERALIASFIDRHVCKESQAEMRSFEADRDRDEAAIKAALPADLQGVFFEFLNRNGTMQWIREEIMYGLGVAVGRRLSGGAR